MGSCAAAQDPTPVSGGGCFECRAKRDDGPPEVRTQRARFVGLMEALHQELASITTAGIEIKDLDTGLCDFYSLREGREVYLCWKLGEPHVGYWHEIEAGFAGRQSLEIEPGA